MAPPVLNQTWALDFMADALYDRRRFRALTVIDEGNREGLAIDVGRSIPARWVTRVLEELIALHGRPASAHPSDLSRTITKLDTLTGLWG